MMLSKRLFAVVICMGMLAACASYTTLATATLSPSNGSTNVELSTPVTAQFFDNVKVPPDWTKSFILMASGSTANLCTAVNYDPLTETATCTHGFLSANTQYKIAIQNIADSNGSEVSVTPSTFSTTSSLDASISAVMVTFSPHSAATDVSLSMPVTAKFSGAVTAPSDWTQAFTLTAAGSFTNLCATLNYDTTTLTATCFHSSLAPHTQYIITIKDLTDAGEMTINAMSTFTTGTGSISAKFTLDNAVPIRDGSINLPISTFVNAIFTGDSPTDSSDWTSYFIVATATDPDTNICSNISYNPASRTARCAATCGSVNNLCHGTQYSIQIIDLPYGAFNETPYSAGPITFTTAP